MSKTEKVLCVPTASLQTLGHFEGLYLAGDSRLSPQQYYTELLQQPGVAYVSRELCENDPSLRQIIPYVAVRNQSRGPVFLRYRRSKESGEGRLVGKASLGVGGHVGQPDQGDDTPQTAVLRACHRELEEELRCDAPTRLSEPVALLNDESDPVGRVHLGVVFLLEVELPCVYPNDLSMQQLLFASWADLRGMDQPSYYPQFGEYENWSRILLRQGYDALFTQF